MTIDLPALELLAQTAPPLPTEGTSGAGNGATTGANGSSGGGAAPGGPIGPDFLVIFVLVIGGLLVFTFLGQRRERKKREAMLSAVRKHDRVQTVGGVIGSVVEVTPHQVVLKVDESANTRITFARSAIQQVLTPGSDASAADESKG